MAIKKHPYIQVKIIGVPYSRNKTRGDVAAPKKWTQAVKDQTAGLPKVTDACLLRVTYLIPTTSAPKDYPYGPDLDNLNKRFLDALSATVFSEAHGKDSCIVAMETMKILVNPNEQETGACIEILPIKIN